MAGNEAVLNWVKMEMILNMATDVVRKIFLRRWKVLKGHEWVSGPVAGDCFIHGDGKEVFKKAQKLQKMSLKDGDVNHWDLPLIATLLRDKKFCPNDDVRQTEFCRENNVIQELIPMRNKIAHHSTNIISNDDFEDMWKTVFDALVLLGEPESDLVRLKAADSVAGCDLSSGEESEDDKTEMVQLRDMGNDHYDRGEYDAAVSKFTEALKLSSLRPRDRATLFANRSGCYLNLESNMRGSIWDFLELSADHEDVRYRALLDAKQVMSLCPTWWRGYYQAGLTYSALNKLENAITLLDRSMALEPSEQKAKIAKEEAHGKLAYQKILRQYLDRSLVPQLEKDLLEDLNQFGPKFSAATLSTIEKELRAVDDTFADVIVGLKYLHGLGDFPQDFDRAALFFSKAAAQDNAEGMFHMGLLMLDGKGLKQDQDQALQKLKKAVELSAGKGPTPISNAPESLCLVQLESQFAKTMNQATGSYQKALDRLNQCTPFPLERMDWMEELVTSLSCAIRTMPHVVKLSPDLMRTVAVASRLVLESQAGARTQLDRDARVCHVQTLKHSYEETITFLQKCLERYQDEPFFFSRHGSFCGLGRDFEIMELDFTLALGLAPGDCELMFQLANVLRLKEDLNIQEAMKAYQKYLDCAPEDHHLYPEACYALAALSYEEKCTQEGPLPYGQEASGSRDAWLRVKQYYVRGEEAEKKQLPFFLPYRSSIKLVMKRLLDAYNQKCAQESCASPATSDTPGTRAGAQLAPGSNGNRSEAGGDLASGIIVPGAQSDHRRIDVIRRHRTNQKLRRPYFNHTKEEEDECKSQRTPESIIGLRSIALRDMEPGKDHVYERTVMEVKVVEEWILGEGGSSADTVVQDTNGDVQHCCVYNLSKFEAPSSYPIGTKLNILNPYLRVSRDGSAALRVDSPKSFLKLGKVASGQVKNVCRLCLAEGAQLRCGGCKRAWYCDRNCQLQDWKLYEHKLICVKVK